MSNNTEILFGIIGNQLDHDELMSVTDDDINNMVKIHRHNGDRIDNGDIVAAKRGLAEIQNR